MLNLRKLLPFSKRIFKNYTTINSSYLDVSFRKADHLGVTPTPLGFNFSFLTPGIPTPFTWESTPGRPTSNKEFFVRPDPEMPISVNPGLKFWFVFLLYISMHYLGSAAFCVIISVSRSKGSTVLLNLELHVLRRENCA